VHRRSMRTIAASLTTISLLLTTMGTALAVDPSGFSGTALEPDGAPIQAAKSRSGALAQTDPALLGRTDTTPVPVFIKLDYDAVASYAGDVAGLEATSPEVTGKSLKNNPAAVDAYTRHLAAKEARAREAIEANVPDSTTLDSLKVVYGGVTAIVPANQIGTLLGLDDVVAVQEDKVEQPLTDVTPDFIGATTAWSQISDSTHAGEGVVVGVLDTGIWPEHPSFIDNGITYTGPTLACEFGDGTDDALGDPFTCNDKLIGAYAFLDTYLAVRTALPGEFCNETTGQCSARDANGHGTHTSSTAAGSRVESVPLYGAERGPISGIAPGAHVVMYRVCGDTGCFQSDSVNAVEQAILDEVDVLNFSISGGNSAYTDAVELAFLDAYAAGILVNASAGNAGPGAATANHAGPWTNTIAASTSNRHFLTDLVLAGEGGATLTLQGATVTAGVDPAAPVVLAQNVPGYTDSKCQTDLPAGSAVGKVVACERGVVARVTKSRHVLPSGAVGMILYNLVPANGAGLNTDNHFVPSVHIDVDAGQSFLDFMADNATVTATWAQGVATEVPGDVMAPFSSRGPLGDFLKPDVTAPGVQILAGNTPVPVGADPSKPGEMFQAIQGTSMSSPHAAGVSALVKAAHPDWTPGQIKSALMTTSLQSVLKEDGETVATPFDRGAGSIRADRALSPLVTLDVTAAEYTASALDPLGRLHLNLPSIYANPMPGAVQTTRTLTNVTGEDQPFTVVTQAPAGATISVSPSNGSVPAGGSSELTITISAPSVPDGFYFGQVTVDLKKGNDAVLPVVFNKAGAAVSLSHSCDPTTIDRGTATDCSVTVENLIPQDAQTNLQVAGPSNNKLRVQNVSAPGVPSGNGFTWSGTLAGTVAPTIDSITDAGGTSPAGGYLPLSLFGFAPLTMGDETITNFNVPAYKYGDEVYERIAVDSNGYVVIGGGTAEDNNCCDPQTFPNPARPNNVMAPYWTDLNPGTGGAVRIGILTDGVTNWLIADWEAVDTFGVPTSASSFQVWIQLGDTEGLWFTYGALSAPSSDGLTVGAENRDGSSGQNLGGAPAAPDYVIETSGPTAGGSVTITYEALGTKVGAYDLTATATSPVFNGTATKVVRITVE
jgi:subtilisin family serine protease